MAAVMPSRDMEATDTEHVPLNGGGGGDPPRVKTISFFRLGVMWVGACICGGVTPGQALFSHLFAKAGLFEDACSASHPLCRDQYMLISNTLLGLSGIITLAMLPGGMLYDSIGARGAAVFGAIMVMIGAIGVVITLKASSGALFVLSVLMMDFGAMINNFGFYGFLWHLPGWQALILAASNGCIQVPAVLPAIFHYMMETWNVSLALLFGGYAAVIVIGAIMTWLAVPSQSEYYAQAQTVLGVPMPRSSRVSMRKFCSSLKDAFIVLRRDKCEHLVFMVLIVLAQLGTYTYNSQTVPFGRTLFQDEDAGTLLADRYTQIQAWMGLVGVPAVGALVDFVGMPVLAALIFLSLLLIVLTCGMPLMWAQEIALWSCAFFMNVFMLLVVKYFVNIAPPQRLGVVQGAFFVCMIVCMAPCILGVYLWVSALPEGKVESYLVPMRSVLVPAVLGWICYFVRMLVKPLPEMVLLEADEHVLMGKFLLRNLTDAETVLELDQKEILRRLSSGNVLDMRELLHLSFSPEARARYIKLAHSRAKPLPARSARLDIDVGNDYHVVSDGSFETVLEALLEAWTGSDGTTQGRGEPLTEWMLGSLDKDDSKFSEFLRFLVTQQIFAGQYFGTVLAIKESEAEDILGVCVSFPPGSLEDGMPMPKGGERWFSLITQHADGLGNYDPRTMDADMIDRLAALGSADMETHHKQQPPHWYVAALGVSPRGRGKGLSRKLLSVVFDWADESKVPVYLECGSVNVPVYEAMGFHDIWKEDVSSQGSSSMIIHGMSRPPGR